MNVCRCCRKDSRFCQSLRDKNVKEGCVFCSKDEKEHNEHDEGAQVSRWKSRKPVYQRILMRWYASSPIKERSDMRDQRRETTRDCIGCK